MTSKIPISRARRFVLIGLMLSGFTVLAGRSAQLQLVDQEFLQEQGDARHLRTVKVPAHRGMIVDRNGEPLAISTPVQSVWVNPQELVASPGEMSRVAELLALGADKLQRLIGQRKDLKFVYLRRRIPPDRAQQIMDLGIRGIYLQREYRRYFPAGEVASHLIGFTNVDDHGQEGLELAYDDWLTGEPGAKRVIKDGHRHIIENVENIRSARPGKTLSLSIDRRIQYLAYRELKAAVRQHNARSGSIVVLDNRTGEVLALANQPSFNPNNRKRLKPSRMRNRAATDVFEPGSTMKPFIIAAALQSGEYQANTRISTSPGQFQVGVYTIKDMHDYGVLDLAGVIRKSSNVAASKIALSLEPELLWGYLSGAGFGQSTGSGFPGEADGHLANYHRWRDIERATLAYGYGLSVTAMQLAQAYSVFANDGYRVPVSLLRRNTRPEREVVYSPEVARSVRSMMESVVKEGGTAPMAAVSGYRVAGKTGTVHKSVSGGYAQDKYISVFAGMAPASDPSLVAVVMINEPRNGKHFGGQVAGPVFSRVMAGALRVLNVTPDDTPLLRTQLRKQDGPA
ncbi:Cell division protein FtsI [Peptidoglycan synthetase] [hydrothermal vent metagenome]|uniref:Cell division protein FtsI [Peptidoglycan synthetase] n=1 Tax=hydrothermal vent metagenome TaxID=652676 RepID=A0A3B0Z2K5_9ZZZZ